MTKKCRLYNGLRISFIIQLSNYRAENDSQVEVQSPVRDGFGHGQARRDAAAAGEHNDVRCVPELFILSSRKGPAFFDEDVCLLSDCKIWLQHV